ncbi:MAG: DUF1854 domain-containing protein, partial [bacterium]
ESSEKPTNDQTGKMSLDLHRRADGRLVLRRENGESETPVQVACCFPWTHPRQFISLRDDKGKEQMLIDDLQLVETPARELIEDELAERNFLPRLTGIQAITDEIELFHWQVTTAAGPRSFLTRRSDHPRKLANGDVLIKDVSNDLYLIPNPKGLDPKSLKLLWAYLD